VTTTAPGIFICYRREGTSGHAGRLYDRLSARFGEERVFMDEEIPAGVDFVEWIEDAIGGAGVMVAVIGRAWLGAPDADGRRRIDDERDFVRSEIAGALERGIRVLPVLVDGAEMPSERDLPAPLAKVATINALELRDGSYWRVGVDRLIERVAALLGETPAAAQPREQRAPVPPPRRLGAAVATAVAGACLLAVGLLLLADVYITPGFNFLPVPGGLFTAPGPLGVLLGSLVALARLRREAVGWLDVGLLAGFGFEAAAKGVSLLGDSAGRVQGGALVWTAGGVVLVAAAGVAARRLGPTPTWPERPSAAVAAVGAVAAALLVAGAVIPFNFATPGGNRIVANDSWAAADPIGTALGVLVAVALAFAGRRRVAAGLLLALGLASALLWVRYVGIPVAQWVHEPDVASPRAGGVVGLAGSLVAAAAGWRLASRPRERRATVPVPTA